MIYFIILFIFNHLWNQCRKILFYMIIIFRWVINYMLSINVGTDFITVISYGYASTLRYTSIFYYRLLSRQPKSMHYFCFLKHRFWIIDQSIDRNILYIFFCITFSISISTIIIFPISRFAFITPFYFMYFLPCYLYFVLTQIASHVLCYCKTWKLSCFL